MPYARCCHCVAPFPPNRSVAHMPADQTKGRALNRSCRNTLLPRPNSRLFRFSKHPLPHTIAHLPCRVFSRSRLSRSTMCVCVCVLNCQWALFSPPCQGGGGLSVFFVVYYNLIVAHHGRAPPPPPSRPYRLSRVGAIAAVQFSTTLEWTQRREEKKANQSSSPVAGK